ncbi:DUF2852 domain-containing protein [Phaeovulum veldkampii]|nr:DUF2852 domain-containing protein [Phaeovulum veldkampii]TDQ60325.1 uncharacterized protein DUF2852 [Phaeovulum veldkampii DSM 11550]
MPSTAPFPNTVQMRPEHAQCFNAVYSRFLRAEDWLDARGRRAWIVVLVLSFMFTGPFGLVGLAYLAWTGRLSSSSPRWQATSMAAPRRFTGNAAFDTYKADMLARLEREQAEFEAFLHRLRAARDKAEFDQYMDERARAAAAPEAPAEPGERDGR